MNRKTAFSIPEMLAVIAIIVIIISLLMPSLANAKKYTRAAICKSNLHQQAVGLIGYTVESRYYPGAHTWSHNAPKNWIIWPSRIREFTEGTSTDWFRCPEGPDNSAWKVSYGSGLPREYGYNQDEVRLEWNTPFSYGYNNWGGHDFAVPQRGLGGLSEHPNWGELRKSLVKSPSNMVAIGDAQVDGVWDAFIDTNQTLELPANRHPGSKANITFCDGHVADFTLTDILAPADLGRWNNDGNP